MDEIKGAISANNTPIKSPGPLDRNHCSEDDLEIDQVRSRRVSSELDLWGRLSDSRKSSYNNLLFLGEHQAKNFTNNTYPLPENIHPQILLENSGNNRDSDIDIQLTTCSQCHKCSVLMLDQDIMAGWSAEDSNLNTTCHACKQLTVPLLSIHITVQKSPNHSKHTDQLSVPFLNPLVLRKELENILGQYGDDVLCKSVFVDKHPIIYWNLVWFMERIAVQTHLSSLFFQKMVSLPTEKSETKHKKVRIF